MQNKLPFIILLSISLVSGILVVNKLSKFDFLKNFNFEFTSSINSISNFTKDINEQNSDTNKSNSNSDNLNSIAEDIKEDEVNLDNIKTPTPTPKKISPTQKPIKINSQPLVCNRFTVLHLDGSSSTLCYSSSDFNLLTNMNSKLVSAKSNYNFEKSVYEMYQKAYEKNNSDIYLEPMAKAKEKMQEYQDLIGEISLQMYNIESRGY